jgi:hypothetical protein
VHFRPVEKLTMAFAGLLVAAGLLRWNALTPRDGLALIALAGLLPVAAAALRARWPEPPLPVRVAGDFQLICPSSEPGSLVRAVTVDRTLGSRADRPDGDDPLRALESIHASSLDVLTVFYALFFFHPLAFAALVWARDRAALGRAGPDFHRTAFLLVLTFYVSYAGYFLVPAVGPATPSHRGPLPRDGFGDDDATLDRLRDEQTTSFPPATRWSFAASTAAARRSRRLAVASLSSRYPSGWRRSVLHYLVDVLAGFALTPVVWLGGGRGDTPGLFL